MMRFGRRTVLSRSAKDRQAGVSKNAKLNNHQEQVEVNTKKILSGILVLMIVLTTWLRRGPVDRLLRSNLPTPRCWQ